MTEAGKRVDQDAVKALLAELTKLLGKERVSTSLAQRENHARDFSFHDLLPADGVAFARSSDEVSAIVKAAAQHLVPVIPYGTGTSVEGHLAAPHGGICLDLSQMDEVLEVNAVDMDATVQPGVTRKKLNDYLRDTGLFFPIDPGADASIGGMAATRASGTNAVRYGTMRENVLGVGAVLADGRIIRTGRRARKSSAGYDLTRLLIGSEGTLGVMTSITLKLYGIPEAVSAAVVSFESLAGAVDAVIATIQWGLPMARIELLDEVQLDAVNKYSNLDYPVRPTLFLEFHGSTTGVEEQAARMAEICAEHGGGNFKWTTDEAERTKLWQARHDAAYAAIALRPGCAAFATDVCVPISNLAQCIMETKKDLEESRLTAPIVGHVGDGNFHTAMLIGPDEREADLEAANEINRRVVERALALDGTCTGEHGVGIGKMKFLEAEHGEGWNVMSDIKRALDPLNIWTPPFTSLDYLICDSL